jgi:hypothetical protein
LGKFAILRQYEPSLSSCCIGRNAHKSGKNEQLARLMLSDWHAGHPDRLVQYPIAGRILMNTYNGFNLRSSVTAALFSIAAVTASILFSATYTVGAVGVASSAPAYTIVTPEA